MTIHLNIGKAKTRLSSLIAASLRGEEVVTDHDGVPLLFKGDDFARTDVARA